ncbi:unnamed protein product, partial [Brenthis ino]
MTDKTVPSKPKKMKDLSREDLVNMNKNELVSKIMQLEAHNSQLKNIISKNVQDSSDKESVGKKKQFDFSNIIGERASHPSQIQIQRLLNFFQQNPELVKGFSKMPSARDAARRKWEKFAVELNRMGGCIKSWKQWTKYWADKKSAVKKKGALRFRTRNEPGGSTIELNSTEEKILALMGAANAAINKQNLKTNSVEDQNATKTASNIFDEMESMCLPEPKASPSSYHDPLEHTMSPNISPKASEPPSPPSPSRSIDTEPETSPRPLSPSGSRIQPSPLELHSESRREPERKYLRARRLDRLQNNPPSNTAANRLRCRRRQVISSSRRSQFATLAEKILSLEEQRIEIDQRNSLIFEKAAEAMMFIGEGMKMCHYRRILLRISYFGWDYQGLAVQEDSSHTIEHHLFHALTKSCLIEKRETSQYHRCGRTDKGVSAFGQVISITLRSKFPPESQNSNISSEMPYCKILNRLLPKEIRALAWMPIPDDKPEFSARFDCKKRQYKYYFPRSSLNIEAMSRACAYLIGSHDFRHLCKMDVGNGVVEFTREIIAADIRAVEEKDNDRPTSMYMLVIEGNAFLWHQIRCIMGVLLLVGNERESPDIVKDLLDIEKISRKPQYNMALDVPLNLYDCTYDLYGEWVYDPDELRNTIAHLQNEWTLYGVKTTMIKDCLNSLETVYDNMSRGKEREDNNDTSERDRVMSHTDCLLQGVKPRVYTPLLERETCSTLEERIDYYRKKRKIEDVAESMNTK